MIYFVIFFVLFFLSFVKEFNFDKQSKFLIALLICFLLILFCGFRGNIEPDYNNYLDIFEKSSFVDYVDLNIEWGFYLINIFFASINIPFQFILFLFSFSSISLIVYHFYRNSPNLFFSILIYYSTIFFQYNFIQIRQAFTLSVFILILPLIKNYRFFLYTFILGLISFIHISALILIPLYFIINRKYSTKLIFILILMCTYINIFEIKTSITNLFLDNIPIPRFIIAKLTIYLSRTEFAFLSVKQLVLAFLFLWLKTKQISDKESNSNFYFNLYFLGIIFSTLFNNLPEFSFRIKWYFFWTESILVVYLINFISKNNQIKSWVCYFVIGAVYLYSLIVFLTQISERGEYIFPYKFFWN